MSMKLSEFAKNNDVCYRTAWNWWKEGKLIGFALPSGSIMVDGFAQGLSKKENDQPVNKNMIAISIVLG